MKNQCFLLGLDIGTSSIKITIVDVITVKSVVSKTIPSDCEREIIVPRVGWAEQDPNMWWEDVLTGLREVQSQDNTILSKVVSIGISYQMHGLVVVDENYKTLRNAIIWCDGRTGPQGNEAVKKIGKDKCLETLLNLPGNFTASKLAWVKENEPEIYAKIHKIMLPGDFIACKLTGKVTSTPSMLSEGAFWNFKEGTISQDILDAFGISPELFGEMQPVFSNHGVVSEEIVAQFGFAPETIVGYKAGDQLNNALSLNVMRPGDIATTAGTSGVIYAVSDRLICDEYSRVNTFAHFNYEVDKPSVGVLLCINGTGISNKWIRNIAGSDISYQEMNELADAIPIGSDGLFFFPFGNGEERLFPYSGMIGAQFSHIDLNKHHKGHLFRAVQEGIIYSMRYGLELMRQIGINSNTAKAGEANMFLSKVFRNAFVNITGISLELYDTEGSKGAAIGGGVGAKVYDTLEQALRQIELIERLEPNQVSVNQYNAFYSAWKEELERKILKGNNNNNI